MKLRIKGNSIRLRISRSELTRLIEEGRIADTTFFGVEESARLTYALEQSDAVGSTQLAARPQEVAVVLPRGVASAWAEGEEVGVYATVDLGPRGALELMVEKDYACLDLSEAENVDTFPNPNAGALC